MLSKRQSHSSAPNSLSRKWSESPALQRHPQTDSRVRPASAHTCLRPSVPSHLNWQCLKPFWPTYRISADDGRKSSGVRMPTACLKEPVPSSVFGTLPAQCGKHLFNEECSNSANFTPTSVWRTISKNCHTLLVWSPAVRMKVVTMAALVKFNGLHILFFWTFFRSSSGFNNLRSW